jgi:hypothetical protein
MARKIIDTWPVISLAPKFKGAARPDQARRAGDNLVALVQRHILPHLDAIAPYCSGLDISQQCEDDARCEHCNWKWTEESAAYNGGCCAKDEANDPERLARLRELAATVSGQDLYRLDDEGQRGRNTVDWPWALAEATVKWLDAGRPVEDAAALIRHVRRVEESEWCTVWSDPGDYPSNAGAGPLPDVVSRATEPSDLADDVRRLISDMGLDQAKAAA